MPDPSLVVPLGGAYVRRMDRSRLTQCVNTVLEAEGFELVRLLNHPHHVVRLWVDRDPGGVGVDDCIRLTRGIRAAIEDEGEDPGDYLVEVQSPGVDRLLVRAKDFERFAGKQVQVSLKEKQGDRRNFKGVLLGIEDGVISVRGPETDEPWRFERRGVKEVRLVPELPFAPAPVGPPGAERTRKPRKARRKRPKQH